MGKVYIDIILEEKKALKKMKDFEKQLEKSIKKTTKNNKIIVKLNADEKSLKNLDKTVKKNIDQIDIKGEVKKINEKFKIEPTLDDKKINDDLSDVRQNLSDFYKRIESQSAKSYASRVVDLKNYKKELQKLQRIAEKTGDIDLANELSTQIETLKLKVTQAGSELRNFAKTGENNVSVLGKNFNSVNKEIAKSREELKKLGKSTKNIDKFDKEVQDLKKSLESGKISQDRYIKGMEKLNNKTQSSIGFTKGLKKSMSSLVGVMAGFVAFSTAKDYIVGMDKAISKLKITTGATIEEVKNFTKSARNLQKDGFGDFDKNLITLSNIKRSLKITGKEAENVAKSVLLISENFDESESEILKATNSLAKNMKLDFEEAGDFILKALQKTNDPDLIDNIAEYSVNFKKMGYSAQDMFNIMIKGAENGAYKLDKVNDAIKEAEVSLTDNSKSTRDAFTKMGLNYDDYLSKIQSGELEVKDVLEVVNSKLLDLDAGLQDEVGTAIYRTKWEELSDEVLIGLTDVEDKLGDVTGTTEKAIQDIGGLTQAVGIFKGVIGGAIDGIRNWSIENPKLSKTLGIVALGLGGLAVAIGTVGLATTLLLPGLISIGAVLSPILVPLLAITGALVALGYAYTTNLGGFSDIVKSLGGTLTEIFSKLGVLIKFIGGLFMAFGRVASEVFGIILNSAIKYLNGLLKIVSGVIQILTGNFQKGTTSILSGFWSMITGIIDLFVGLGKFVVKTSLFIGKTFLKLVVGVGALWADMVQNIAKILINLGHNAVVFIKNLAGTFTSIDWGRVWSGIGEWFGKALNNIIDSAKNVGKKIANFFKNIFSGDDAELTVKANIQKMSSGEKKKIQNEYKNVLEGVNFKRTSGIFSSIADDFKATYPILKNNIAKTTDLNNQLIKNEKISQDKLTKEKLKGEKDRQILDKLNKPTGGSTGGRAKDEIKEEKELEKIKENNYKEEIKRADEIAKGDKKNGNNKLEQYKARVKAIEYLQGLQVEFEIGSEKELELQKEINKYKEEMGRISEDIFKEEQKSLEKISKTIVDLQNKAKNITEKKDTSISKRKLDIEKERLDILEKIAGLENSGTLGKTSKRVQKIDKDLEGNLNENQRNKLLDKKAQLLEKINDKIKNANNLNGQAYDLKQKILALDNEEKTVNENLNSDNLLKLKEDEKKTKTDLILETFKLEKEKIEEKLALSLEAYEEDKLKYSEILDSKSLGEYNFTSLISGEIQKRIAENEKLLNNAKRIASEMARLGFSGKGFTASFKKTNSETGKTTTVNRTIKIVNNATINNSIDERNLTRKIVKSIQKAENTGNIV